MPKMTGHVVLSRLSRLATRIPAMVITGHDTPETRARVLTARAAAYLLKPVDGLTLLNTITAAVASELA